MSIELRVENYSLTKIMCLLIITEINKNKNMSRTDETKTIKNK